MALKGVKSPRINSLKFLGLNDTQWSQVGRTADLAGAGGERQLQQRRVDAHAESSAVGSVRGEHAVNAVQPEHGRTVPGRLGEQAVHQSAVHAAAAGQELPGVVAPAAAGRLSCVRSTSSEHSIV